jgi:hypothetical protein
MLSESACYGFAMNITPPSFKTTVKVGESTTGNITVINKGEIDIGVKAYVQDWVYDSEGRRTFHAAGTTPYSCAKWIHLFPTKFQLEAGKKMGVQYTINVPADAKGGYYAVIFFESIPMGEYEGEEGVVVRFSGRLGTIAYIETETGSVYNGAIESLSVTPPQSNKPLEMALSFENTGNVYIGAEGILNIIDEEGNIFGKEKFGPLNTLPGDTREAKLEWFGDLEEGTYYAVVTLDIGTGNPIVKERKLNIFFGGAVNTFSIDLSSGKPSFSVIVENTGHLNIDASGRIELIKDGELTKSISLEKSLIAPGKEKEFKGSFVEDLPQGIYTAKAIVSVGGREFIKEEVFSIK